ncbi:MAG: hypothetical protein ASARMPREDX12_000234 [Alectoria sarmentosa]|nr:MAG: hypothetical protein ASARMPREDX12_000234 [Alectoria sarmentosa]
MAWLTLLYGILAVTTVSLLRNALRPGLRDVPGPFLAKFSNLWRLYTTWQRTFKDDIPVLHKKYGSSLVRIGPNLSDMVKPMLPIFRGKKQPTMFAAGDNKTHGRLRRPVAGAFAMTKMTMSRSIGFMKAGGDVDGVLKTLQKELDYRGITLAMPGLDDIFRLNPISAFLRPNQTAHFAQRSRRILEDRLSEKDGADEVGRTRPLDFTHRFLEAQKKDPTITDGQMIGYVQANLVAGSDTTAIAMRTAIYYTLKTPWILKRLREELDSRNITYPIPYKTAYYELPFCAAVVKEALRYHFPLIGLMERLIPESGLELPDGKKLPGGTVIGMQPDLIGCDKGIYGADADEFNPVRWLQAPGETDKDHGERLKAMNGADLAFGYGPRACLGKHVAEMEIYKFIPTLFGLLDLNFVRPNEPWKLRKLFIVKQSGMDMYMSWREGKNLDSLKA